MLSLFEVALAVTDVGLAILWFREWCAKLDAQDELKVERQRPRRLVQVTRYVAYCAEDALTMMLHDQED